MADLKRRARKQDSESRAVTDKIQKPEGNQQKSADALETIPVSLSKSCEPSVVRSNAVREFHARELDYIINAITTGRQLERLADAVAEAVMTKLSRYQRLELDAQFIADAVMKRLDEERQVSRIVLELIRGGLEPEASAEHAGSSNVTSSETAKSRIRKKK